MARPNKFERIHGTTILNGSDANGGIVHPEAVQQARRGLPENEIVGSMTDLFAALGDPTRLRIIAALASGELCVRDLAATLGLQQSAISHQLRNLRKLGLAKSRRSGRLVYYSLDDDHVSTLFSEALEHVSHKATHTENEQ